MSKPTVLWTSKAKEDLARIWTKNPQFHDELAFIRPRLEQRLESDPEGVALEVRPEGEAVGLEPRTPLDHDANIAIGVLYIVSERKVLRAWLYVKPSRRRADG